MAKTHKRMARLERMMAKLLAEVAYLKDELITKPEAERVLRKLQEEERRQEYEKWAKQRMTNAPGAQLQSGVALKQQYQMQQALQQHMSEHAKEMMLDDDDS